MKLQTINSGIDDSFASSIRILLNGCVSDTISENIIIYTKHGKLTDRPSFQYFFVESAINSGLLTEADLSGLQAILQAGLAKLQAALSPGTASDLDALMAFMAPGTGGSKAVNDLISAAKSSRIELSQNEDWWNDLFSTMNVTDPTIQKDIQYQVADEVNQEMLRDPGLPSPDSGEEAESAEQARQQTREALNQDSYVDELNKEKSEAEQWRKQLLDTIANRRADQQTASNQLDQLNARLSKLMKQAPNTESFMRPIGDILLEFDSVRPNVRRITNTAIKTINKQYEYNIPTITEAGLLDKLRTLMANPKYANRQIQSSASRDKNVQAAKLAVKIATDHLREQFNAKLQDAGLMPSDIIKIYSQWSNLKSNNGDPGTIARLEEQLRKAFQLFDIKSNGESGEVGPQDSTSGGASVADGGSDPLNADEENPQAARGLPHPNNPLAPSNFQETVAKLIIQKAIKAAQEGKDYRQIIADSKKVARKVYKFNPQMTQEVWNTFVKWLRKARHPNA